jgi:hypothetical protein
LGYFFNLKNLRLAKWFCQAYYCVMNFRCGHDVKLSQFMFG